MPDPDEVGNALRVTYVGRALRENHPVRARASPAFKVRHLQPGAAPQASAGMDVPLLCRAGRDEHVIPVEIPDDGALKVLGEEPVHRGVRCGVRRGMNDGLTYSHRVEADTERERRDRQRVFPPLLKYRSGIDERPREPCEDLCLDRVHDVPCLFAGEASRAAGSGSAGYSGSGVGIPEAASARLLRRARPPAVWRVHMVGSMSSGLVTPCSTHAKAPTIRTC